MSIWLCHQKLGIAYGHTPTFTLAPTAGQRFHAAIRGCILVTLAINWFFFHCTIIRRRLVVLSDISQQLSNGFPWNLVVTFMYSLISWLCSDIIRSTVPQWNKIVVSMNCTLYSKCLLYRKKWKREQGSDLGHSQSLLWAYKCTVVSI